MASSTTSRPPPGSPIPPSLDSPISIRHRRESVNSASASSATDREQLAHALDQIHTTASRSDGLTTFNDFAPPPDATPAAEARGTTGELVQQGLSGLYSRFREAVVGPSPTKPPQKDDDAKSTTATASKRTSIAETHASKNSVSSLNRGDTVVPTATSLPLSSSAELSSTGTFPALGETRAQISQSAKSNSISLMAGQKSQTSGRQSLPTSTTTSAVSDPAIATVTIHRDASRSTIHTDDSTGQTSSRKSLGRIDTATSLPLADHTGPHNLGDGKLPHSPQRTDASSVHGSIDAPLSPPATSSSAPVPPIQSHHIRTASNGSSMLSPDDVRRRPAMITRISGSRSPLYSASRSSSADRGMAEATSFTTSAHNSVYHESFSQDSHQEGQPGNFRIPGTTGSLEYASDQMNAQLDKMRRQVLSKEFWMKDDTVKECFLCQTPFSAFRRKHHCRTCGCIFDSKCTTVVSGEKFGVQGSLRVCKRCLDVITRRLDDGSGSDSGDEQSFMPKIFGFNHPKSPRDSATKLKDQDVLIGSEGSEDTRPVSTPMMAIPATRRVNKESNRKSAILEIDAPQLSRPGSSRSLKSMASARPQSSAGHRRHHSKHGFLGRFKPTPVERAPFRNGIDDDNANKSKFSAFHDDNIIDPELADYMSDDSSGDEQVNIFSTMATNDIPAGSYENDRSDLGPFMNAQRKYRHRQGEKSISGMSYVSRGALDDVNGPASLISHRRNNRRRNLSNVSGSVHHFASPRPKSAIYKGPSASTEMLFAVDNQNQGGTQLTRSDSLQKRTNNKEELNQSSLRHVDKLLHQLLEDVQMPEPGAWQKALVPILLKSTDDVTPDVAKGEDMDIRHYVKLKRIPGGKPGDTSYISGVVFTKNLALKSMPRRIINPRILLVTFPIEYQRHQQHFMSLQPVIEQEREFLRVVVQRITSFRPHVLLAEKGVSGIALQYLSDANISVAYNVKHTVIEAVARCAETEIISSLDMLALPVQVGRCSAFEVKTYVNNDYPGRKKSYIFLSGCRPELGCTIALRGANSALLTKIKHILEFMVYVVYNLKLESSLLRDESVEAPEGSESLSSSINALNDSFKSVSSASVPEKKGTPVAANQTSTESEPPKQSAQDNSSVGGADEAGSLNQTDSTAPERPKLVSLHESHTNATQETQVPDDVPMPTFYSEMVAKYETKILSASPYVKFKQPYLLMKAREQERRLLYLKRLRDHDTVEEIGEDEKATPQKFQLIKPELVEEIGQKAPRQIMDILHAVHDAEYDKALFNYQTQTRQWETYIQGNLDLFDPYSHQNIVVLYSVICTDTKIPCLEPTLVAINFYDEQHVDTGMDPDCTLGQYVEDLIYSKDDICNSNGCEKKMQEHHRTYVHDQWRITVFVEHVPNASPRRSELGDGITMWTYCKVCKRDSEERNMSASTFKYSFGKYLELLYWGRGMQMKDSVECAHSHHQDHVRYFSLNSCRIRIHWDPIDLLEIVVPRTRITWKVVNDLKLKNEIYTRMESRWTKFMASVKARLKSIRIDSVLPEKAESCKTQLDKLSKKAQEDQQVIIRRLQEVYVMSKYHEVVPFNSLVREMLEQAGEWDQIFARFETEFLGDKDMRQLTMMQLKKMFTDNESKESLASNEGSSSVADSDERPSQTFSEVDDKSTQPTDYTENSMEASATSSSRSPTDERPLVDENGKVDIPADGAIERVRPLDLGGSSAAINMSPSNLDEIGEATPASDLAVSPPPVVAPIATSRAPADSPGSGQTLTEKVDQIRREQALQRNQSGTSEPLSANSDTPRRASDRNAARKSGSNFSPPITRAISHPVRTLPRSQSSAAKAAGTKETKVSPPDSSAEHQPDGSIKVDKKLSDILGLTALKNRGKGASSGIPRLVQKKRESKVALMAKHFEQLSREIEKERNRDRKKRAASLRQPRLRLPRMTTKAIVEVYDDVNEAFEETNPTSDQTLDQNDDKHQTSRSTSQIEEPIVRTEPSTEPPTPTEGGSSRQDCQSTVGDNDDAATTNTSHGASDDEGGVSDSESTVPEDLLPEIKEIADSLEPNDIPLELPKLQKTSLMKYLTNFWAERSAAGWPPLEYPVNATDHIFVDSDIIVREDEPSSVIALALNSDDYQGKLDNIRRDAEGWLQREAESGNEYLSKSAAVSDSADWVVDEADLEQSLLRVTGTHLKYQFKEGVAIMTCKIFYAEQFDALRRKCGVAERIVESLSRCLKWDSRGGKTKSVFLKTLDDRFVLKSLSPIETSAFLRFAPGYFSIMAEALFHDLPSVIAKMLGFFQVLIKNPVTGTDVRLDLLVTENLFYDRSPSRIFDLKGSMRNRKIQSTGEQNEVLLDENMVEYIYESPLFAREHSKKLLRASVWNDTLFLARQNVMDYSLMIAVDDARKELVVGIIDCIRTYTWDKKLESWIKDRGFAGGNRNRPTVTSPREYKSRFREAMARYILQAPNCWHLFNNPQYPVYHSRARFEEPESIQ